MLTLLCLPTRSDAARGYKTVGIGGDYSSLAAWEAWASTQTTYDAVTALCIDTGGTNSLGDVTITSSSRPPSNGFETVVTAQSGHAHDWSEGNGALCGTVQILDVSHVHVRQMRTGAIGVSATMSTLSGVMVDGCIIDTDSASGLQVGGSVVLNVTARNTLVANCLDAWPAFFVQPTDQGVCTLSAINSASADPAARSGFEAYGYILVPFAYAYGTLYATNCFVSGSTANDFYEKYYGAGGATLVADYCASSDQTADDFGGANCITGVTASAAWLTSGDYRIPVGSPLQNAGRKAALPDADMLGRPWVGASADIGPVSKFLVNPCP